MNTQCQAQFMIKNKLGLHARAASLLAQLAMKFDASITLIQDQKEAQADSVLALMLLESSQGKTVTVKCDGQDAQAALQAIGELIEERFHEGE